MAKGDLIGVKFGKLTPVKVVGFHEKKRCDIYECKCDCGGSKVTLSAYLRQGHTKSCGCLWKERFTNYTPPNFKDLTGERFGRLVVLKKVEWKNKNVSRWLCKCDCGNEKEVLAGNLKKGQIKSCGCYNSDRMREIKTTHGLGKHPLYRVWSWMITRCYNQNATVYPHYGGRGIKVCEEWRIDFMNFYNDMKDGYMKGLELDRIDVNGDYCKPNCRWITHKENCRNKRRTVFLTVDGVKKSAAEWAEDRGVIYQSIYGRFIKGLPDKRAVYGMPRIPITLMDINNPEIGFDK